LEKYPGRTRGETSSSPEIDLSLSNIEISLGLLGMLRIWGGSYTNNKFDITSTVDDITIQGVSLNRGQCTDYIISQSQFPIHLKFSESFTIQAPGCNNIIEIALKTNRGIVQYPIF
jgi:hypothetical protein